MLIKILYVILLFFCIAGLLLVVYFNLKYKGRVKELNQLVYEANKRALKTEEINLLRKILSASFNQDKLSKSAEKLVEVLEKHFNTSYCSMFLIDKREKPKLLASNAEAIYYKMLEAYCGASYFLLKEKKQRARIECSDSPLNYMGAAERQIKYSYFIPLLTNDEVIGALLMENRNREGLERIESEFFKVVVNSLQVSLQNILYNDKIRSMSMVDALTGAYNRRYMEQLLQEEIKICEIKEKSFVLAIFDIDHFKRINDSYGHPFGDQVLIKVSAYVRESIRLEQDFLFRYGGEEFVILLRDCSIGDALNRIEEIRRGIAKLQFNEAAAKELIKVTASFGMAEYPKDGQGVEELVERADKAMYHSKECGRNRTTIA